MITTKRIKKRNYKSWKMNIDFAVSQNWIDDGFDLVKQKSQVEDKLREILGWAYEEEVKIKIEIRELKNKSKI